MKLLDKVRDQSQMGMLPDEYRQLSVAELEDRVRGVKGRLGSRVFIPCHHYQKDEVVQFADAIGDSLQLAQLSAENTEAEVIVFCGVHFMAESADMLTKDHQRVLLPDLRAGCSMADMADIRQTERCWDVMQETFGDTVLPLTYVNSTAAIKAFVGSHGGATVTSSNAAEMVKWAFTQKERLLFLPDQHLGRNVCVDIGIPLEKIAVWDQINERFEFDGDLQDAKVILWKGHCSVHQNFTVGNIEQLRREKPDMKILVHPECPYETVAAADYSGSTHYIVKMIEQAEPGSRWAIGTEMNLVMRLKAQHPDKEIISLNPHLCPCLTMNRITLPHLLWSLESIESGEYIHTIKVEKEIATPAVLALDRMLQLSK